MEQNIIQRAFELAPQCRPTNELRRRLAGEGYVQVDAHLAGLGIQRELRKLYNNGMGTKRRGRPPRQMSEESGR